MTPIRLVTFCITLQAVAMAATAQPPVVSDVTQATRQRVLAQAMRTAPTEGRRSDSRVQRMDRTAGCEMNIGASPEAPPGRRAPVPGTQVVVVDAPPVLYCTR